MKKRIIFFIGYLIFIGSAMAAPHPLTATEAEVRAFMARIKGDESYFNPSQQNWGAVFNEFLEQYAFMDGHDVEGHEGISHQNLLSLLQPILAEEERQKEKYVTYHAMPSWRSLEQDIMTLFWRKLTQNEDAPPIFRWWAHEDLPSSSLSEFYAARNKLLSEVLSASQLSSLQKLTGPLASVYSYTETSDVILCTNPSLFSNTGQALENTFYYWAIGGKSSPESRYRNLRLLLQSLGVPHVDECIINEVKSLSAKTTRLCQIFWDPDTLGASAYLTTANYPLGRPTTEEDQWLIDADPRSFIEQLRRDPKSLVETYRQNPFISLGNGLVGPHAQKLQNPLFHFHWVQLRCLLTPTTPVQVFSYPFKDLRSDEQKKTYWESLNRSVDFYLGEALKRGLNGFRIDGKKPALLLQYERDHGEQTAISFSDLQTWMHQPEPRPLLQKLADDPALLSCVLKGMKGSILFFLIQEKRWDIIQHLNFSSITWDSSTLSGLNSLLWEVPTDVLKGILPSIPPQERESFYNTLIVARTPENVTKAVEILKLWLEQGQVSLKTLFHNGGTLEVLQHFTQEPVPFEYLKNLRRILQRGNPSSPYIQTVSSFFQKLTLKGPYTVAQLSSLIDQILSGGIYNPRTSDEKVISFFFTQYPDAFRAVVEWKERMSIGAN